jgi:hypothetical protein
VLIALCLVAFSEAASVDPVSGSRSTCLPSLAAAAAASDGEPAIRSIGVCGYIAESEFLVSVEVTPPAGTLAQAVEDEPPDGWTVGTINSSGVFDAATGKVKWGPFFDASPRTLTYALTPPGSASGRATFTGAASFDGGGDPIAGTATLDPDPIFADGFESGDVSAWASASTGGGDLMVAGAPAALDGSFGLSAFVNDTQSLFVEDETPAADGAEACYRMRFLFDPNDFDPGEAAGRRRVRLFLALQTSPATARVFVIVLRRLNGAYSVMARARRDDGSRANTGFTPIGPGPHSIQVEWHRASGPGMNDGSLQLWIDEASVPTLTAIDNDTAAIHAGRLGMTSVKLGAAGTVYFDRFESRRQSLIGS